MQTCTPSLRQQRKALSSGKELIRIRKSMVFRFCLLFSIVFCPSPRCFFLTEKYCGGHFEVCVKRFLCRGRSQDKGHGSVKRNRGSSFLAAILCFHFLLSTHCTDAKPDRHLLWYCFCELLRSHYS